MKGVYVFLADGFEEIEALATVDILRRGGVEATTVSISKDRTVRGAHGIPVVADMGRDGFDAIPEQEAGPEDAMVFPGGLPGASNLAGDEALMDLMKRHFIQGGTVAAICAAPGLVASQLPDLEGRRFTCYDGFEEDMMAQGAEYTGERAVSDGNLITGRGPGCAVEFALTVLARLKGESISEGVRAGLLI